MAEWKLFDELPDYTTAAWYLTREHAPHMQQPAHYGRLMKAAEFVDIAIDRYGVNSISDLGAGDGALLKLIESNHNMETWGYDLMPANVAYARDVYGVNVYLADVVTGDWWESGRAVGVQPAVGQLSICTEFLEHLVDPHKFVREIESGVVVASSPWAETPANHYENHAWCWDMLGYHNLFEDNGWDVERHEVVGWSQLILAVRP